MNYAVIMAGGSGQRLWPLSRKNRPKQILDLFDNQSLLQLCVNRLQGLFTPEQTIIVTNAEYADVVRTHLPAIPAENILGEPVGRDTSNAIGLAASILQLRDPNAIMAVFSADQIIEPVEPLQNALRTAIHFLESHPRALFTFGIKAAYAHTGFGYLKRGPHLEEEDSVFPVEAFKEKPNKSTARTYIRSGEYCWNSGMFVWRVDTILQQLERFLPHNFERLQTIAETWNTPEKNQVLQDEFTRLEKISIDFGVMERAMDVFMCELDCHWVDVGSYQALADAMGQKDIDNNITLKHTLCEWIDSGNNIAISDSNDHLIVAIHAEDLIIVHTDDATLICHRDETDDHLKKLLERMAPRGLQKYL